MAGQGSFSHGGISGHGGAGGHGLASGHSGIKRDLRSVCSLEYLTCTIVHILNGTCTCKMASDECKKRVLHLGTPECLETSDKAESPVPAGTSRWAGTQAH